MIISRTPLRISFVGGGTDFKEYYLQTPGAVVSTAINKFIYVLVNRKFGGEVRVSYSKNEIVDSVSSIEHDLVREVLKFCGIERGIEVVIISDLPLRRVGTGLGASSSLIVGLLQALAAFREMPVTPEKLARDACRIEIDILGYPAGKQDQYIAAYGGLQYIRFEKDESVRVVPLTLSSERKTELERNLFLFHTGLDAQSHSVLIEQKSKIEQNRSSLDVMASLANTFASVLRKGDVRMIGEALHENWVHKKTLASTISNSIIDTFYEKARRAGAIGGKILGSGGGGFLLLYCMPEKHEALRDSLQNFKEMSFRFERTGSKIIYRD